MSATNFNVYFSFTHLIAVLMSKIIRSDTELKLSKASNTTTVALKG